MMMNIFLWQHKPSISSQKNGNRSWFSDDNNQNTKEIHNYLNNSTKENRQSIITNTVNTMREVLTGVKHGGTGKQRIEDITARN